MQTYKDFIHKHINLEEEDWNLFQSRMEIRHFKKGDIISYQDDIWTELLYINSGFIRSYIINDSGQEFTRHFHFNTKESDILNLFVVDYTSFIDQVPSSTGFEVMEDAEVSVLKHADAQLMYGLSQKWERYGRRMAELAYIRKSSLYEELLITNAKQRYISLITTMDEWFNKVPQYHLATYLGITPVSLSRIKKEVELESIK